MNAFVQAPTTEEYYTEYSPKFGNEHLGMKAIAKGALCGMELSGKNFWNHLRDSMCHMVYKSCLTNAHLCMRHYKVDNGTKYYEYIFN